MESGVVERKFRPGDLVVFDSRSGQGIVRAGPILNEGHKGETTATGYYRSAEGYEYLNIEIIEGGFSSGGYAESALQHMPPVTLQWEILYD